MEAFLPLPGEAGKEVRDSGSEFGSLLQLAPLQQQLVEEEAGPEVYDLVGGAGDRGGA